MQVILETDSKPKDRSIRQFGKLWPFLRYAFLATIVSEIVLGASNAHAFSFIQRALQGEAVSESGGSFVDLHQTIAGILYLTAFIVSIVAYCRFYYRAMKNLTLYRAANIRTSPFWAAGSFFVPIVNLWKPLGAVRQIWRASHDPAFAKANVPAMIGWWWFFWLLSNFTGNLSFRLLMSSGALGDQITNYDAYLGSLIIDMISAPISIASAALVLLFSKRILIAQQQNIIL